MTEAEIMFAADDQTGGGRCCEQRPRADTKKPLV
jgi:hypothetical protein